MKSAYQQLFAPAWKRVWEAIDLPRQRNQSTVARILMFEVCYTVQSPQHSCRTPSIREKIYRVCVVSHVKCVNLQVCSESCTNSRETGNSTGRNSDAINIMEIKSRAWLLQNKKGSVHQCHLLAGRNCVIKCPHSHLMSASSSATNHYADTNTPSEGLLNLTFYK